MINITPCADVCGSHRTGTIRGLTKYRISEILGFIPNVKDDPDKVVNSWGFKVDGVPCAIWDYKGSHHFDRFSTWGAHDVFKQLFGDNYVAGS